MSINIGQLTRGWCCEKQEDALCTKIMQNMTKPKQTEREQLERKQRPPLDGSGAHKQFV